MNYLTLACEHLGITAAQVLASAEKETEIVLVVDNGIAGCPKHTIPLELLHEKDEDEKRLLDALAELNATLASEAETEEKALPAQAGIAYDATTGAKRQAQMSGVSMASVAAWTETLPERRGERITVHTVRDYVRRGTIRLTARRGDK